MTVTARQAIEVVYADTLVSGGSTTKVLTEGVDYTLPAGADSTNCFVMMSNARYTGMGSTIGTAPLGLHDFGVALQNPGNLATSLTLQRGGTLNDIRVQLQFICYVGPAGGPNEFIVRSAVTFSTSGTALNSDAAPYVDFDRCVTFLTSQRTGTASNSVWHEALWRSLKTDLGSSQWRGVLNRVNSGGTATASMALVEFTGSNWGSCKSQSITTTGSVWVPPTDNTSFNVSLSASVKDRTRTALLTTYRTSNNPTGVDDSGDSVELTSESVVAIRNRASVGTRDKGIWTIEHDHDAPGYGMEVQNFNIVDDFTSAGPRQFTHSIPSPVRAIDEASSFISASVNGTGAGAPRSSIDYRVTGTTTLTFNESNGDQWRRLSVSVVEWPRDMVLDPEGLGSDAVAPTVEQTGPDQNVVVAAASLTLSVVSPTVDQAGAIEAAPALTLDTVAPTVEQGAADQAVSITDVPDLALSVVALESVDQVVLLAFAADLIPTVETALLTEQTVQFDASIGLTLGIVASPQISLDLAGPDPAGLTLASLDPTVGRNVLLEAIPAITLFDLAPATTGDLAVTIETIPAMATAVPDLARVDKDRPVGAAVELQTGAFPPDVSQDLDLQIAVPVATLALSSLAPGEAGQSVTVEIAQALSLASVAPSVGAPSQEINFTVDQIQPLSLAVLAPTVVSSEFGQVVFIETVPAMPLVVPEIPSTGLAQQVLVEVVPAAATGATTPSVAGDGGVIVEVIPGLALGVESVVVDTPGCYRDATARIRSRIGQAVDQVGIPTQYPNEDRIQPRQQTFGEVQIRHIDTEHRAWGDHYGLGFRYRLNIELRLTLRSEVLAGDREVLNAADQVQALMDDGRDLTSEVFYNISHAENLGQEYGGAHEQGWRMDLVWPCWFECDIPSARSVNYQILLEGSGEGGMLLESNLGEQPAGRVNTRSAQATGNASFTLEFVAGGRDETHSIVRQRFGREVDDLIPQLVIYDNDPAENPYDEMWIRFEVQTMDAEVVELGPEGAGRIQGVATAYILSPLGAGSRESLALADQIVLPFFSVSEAEVHFTTPSVETIGRSGQWWQTNVRLPFYFDEVS